MTQQTGARSFTGQEPRTQHRYTHRYNRKHFTVFPVMLKTDVLLLAVPHTITQAFFEGERTKEEMVMVISSVNIWEELGHHNDVTLSSKRGHNVTKR